MLLTAAGDPAGLRPGEGFVPVPGGKVWYRIVGGGTRTPLAPRLGELRLSVLFLTGRYDEATPETVAEFQRLVPGSELVVLEDSAHMEMLDEPEPFMAAVRSFLRRADQR